MGTQLTPAVGPASPIDNLIQPVTEENEIRTEISPRSYLREASLTS